MIITFKEANFNKRFKCSICMDYHRIPDGGYSLNQEAIDLLLKVESVQIVCSEDLKQLKRALIRSLENFESE